MRTSTRLLLRVAVSAAFLAALSPAAFGQSAQQRMEEARRVEAERRARDNELREAAWELRMAEVRRPPEKRRDATLAYAQIRDDYKQIQVVNNSLAKSVAAGGPLDLKYVSKSVSEIKSRASRLKENLMLPEAKSPPERPREEPLRDEQLKSSLARLDGLVMEFIDSPIFEQAKAVNLEQAAKARRNLEEIIELSEQIKKSSEKLKNSAQKTQ
jgi:malonyl CoA-acyl carrier protein transacylase